MSEALCRVSDTSYTGHYCYRIDFADGFTYFGVRSCNCDPADDTSYMGSPVTHAAKWLTDIPRVKTIVSVHATRELAEIAEDELILAFWAVSKQLSLNASINGTKFHRLGAKHTEEAKAKMSKPKSAKHRASLSKPKSAEHRIKTGAVHKGRKWYANGTTSIRLKPGDTIPEGFKLGNLNAGSAWYTDGTTSIKLKHSDIAPKGFRLGRTMRSRKQL